MLRVEPVSDRVGLRFFGEINLVTRNRWEAALEPLMQLGTDVFLDLSDVVFSDAAGSAVLVTNSERLLPGRRIVLSHPPTSMRRTLELLYQGVSKIEVQGLWAWT